MRFVGLLVLLLLPVATFADHWTPWDPNFCNPAAGLPAFPGAEGFAASACGGRGGKVIAVTSVADSGPGSLREAIDDPGDALGRKIIVFHVGGTITLDDPLVIRTPNLTIAGQTAPGDGILIRNTLQNKKTPLRIEASNVIVRHLRIRTGYDPTWECDDSEPPPANCMSCVCANGVETHRTVSIGNEHGPVSHVILDHLSLSWGTDELINTWWEVHDITVQWSVISEGLNKGHKKLDHGYGPLFGTDPSARISFHHNLVAHQNQRSPRYAGIGTFDVVNNLIYDWGFSPSVTHYTGMATSPLIPVNYIDNFYIIGPDSLPGNEIRVSGSDPLSHAVYIEGNLGPYRVTPAEPEICVVKPLDRGYVVGTRHAAPPVTTSAAGELVGSVLPNIGAYPERPDAVDLRIRSELLAGQALCSISTPIACDSYACCPDASEVTVTCDCPGVTCGGLIDNQEDVGGWPTIDPGTPVVDSDNDGLPDEFETAFGFDPGSVVDGQSDADSDGYSNLEEFLNATHPLLAESVGRVPTGGSGSVPLRIGKSLTTPAGLELTWGASCGSTASDYTVQEGTLGVWYDHTPVACTTDRRLYADLSPTAGNRYFLVAALDAAREGSHGSDSAGVPRPRSLSVCRPGFSTNGCSDPVACGDTVCATDESCMSCPGDCGGCPPTP